MKQYISKTIAYLMFAFFSISCIDEFNADLGKADSNILIVEGNIYSDSLCVFYLTHSIDMNESDYRGINIDNAKLRITGSNGAVFDGRYAGSGAYEVKTTALDHNEKYSLEIEWDGCTFTSTPASPIDAPEIENITFAQPRADMKVDIMVTNKAPESNKTGYYRYTYDEIWEIRAKFETDYEYDPSKDKIVPFKNTKSRGWLYGKYRDIITASTAKFNDNRIKNYRLFQIENDDLRLSNLYCCNIYQYGISQAQYEYEETRKELSSEMGGMFAPQPSELFTNISSSDKNHRAIGYVGVCGKVTTYRLWISKNDIVFDNSRTNNINVLDDETVDSFTFIGLYNNEYRVAELAQPVITKYHWVVRQGVDVTAYGATLEKPAIWPN